MYSLIHIGKRKACPSYCPVCGTSTENPYASGTDAMSTLKWAYSWPNRVLQREVPGWNGFTTWYLECYHESPITNYVYMDSPLLSFIKKSDAFCGRYYPLPLKVTYDK